MSLVTRLASALSVVAIAATLAPVDAGAALVTRQFEFSSTSGALQFGPKLGTFTYDDAIAVAPTGGGRVSLSGLFTDLDVSFGAFSFDETTANSGYLDFDASGNLVDALFGNNCVGGVCVINASQPQWWIMVGAPGISSNQFIYSGFNGETGFPITSANRLLPTGTVPEPASLALVAIALLGAASAARRRQQ